MFTFTRAERLSRTQSLAHSLLLATLGAVALAVISQLRIPLPFTPVPVTLQVLGVLLLGGLLGPWLGAAAVVEYLLLGACGLPVFSNFSAGMLVLSGVTAGYLFAFVPATALFGALCVRLRSQTYPVRLVGMLASGLVAVALIYLGGWAWLAGALHLGPAKAYALGVVPFILIDLIKAAVAASTLSLRGRG